MTCNIRIIEARKWGAPISMAMAALEVDIFEAGTE
jgi:hypothetical protein